MCTGRSVLKDCGCLCVQLGYYTNQPVDYSLAANGLAAWAALAFGIAYTVGNRGEMSGGKDIY
jgi:hypothetical protein